MAMYKKWILAVLLMVITRENNAQPKPQRIWYTQPAAYWEETLPLGNGRLGAMPDGGIQQEHIVLNDISLWSGAPQDADRSDAYSHLSEIQNLLFAGKNIDAQQVMSKYFVSKGPGSGNGNGANVPYGSYQILGNLTIRFDYGSENVTDQVKEYHRELSLNNAIASTKFTLNNAIYRREYFTSFDDDVIMVKLSCNELKKIGFRLSLDRPEKFETKLIDKELQMSGQLNNGTDGKGMKYVVRVKIKLKGGRIITHPNELQVESADEAIIYISAGTNYKNHGYIGTSKKLIDQSFQKSYAVEKANHSKQFQKLFNRASLDLENDSKDSLPTNRRLLAFASDKSDNGMAALYYQFGRYLLISSTRKGLLPPNLQGLWANTIETPWNGDYHLNINIQMNHWPLEVTNLGKLNEPFFTLVKSLVPNGEKTAMAYYHSKGWVAHTITNLWGYTSPGEDYSWGSFNTGSAWLCQMLWSHYEFTNDTAYLRILYPIIKGSAEFYLSTLVKDPALGWLVTSPSNSPENAFIMPDGKRAHVCESPTIDNQILRSLFGAVIESGKKLNRDREFVQQLETIITQLPPDQIGKDGRLMEWLKEYGEAEPHHRHVSLLWGLHPGNEISITTTPELAKAAKASLEARGDDGTGWSLAWKINFWARLHEGNRSFALLGKLLRPISGNSMNMSNGGGTYNNLFCGHTPFQIDGNFGGTAGIAEMLLQSQNGYIEVLPALPAQWKNGEFSGWCVRGGGEVSAKWENGQVTWVSLKATVNNTFTLKAPVTAVKIAVKKHGKYQTMHTYTGLLVFQLKKGEVVDINF